MFNKIIAEGASIGFDLKSEATYLESARKSIQNELEAVIGSLKGLNLKDITDDQKNKILTHPDVENGGVDLNLSPSRFITLNRERPNQKWLQKAKSSFLNGKIIFEHTAAGAATRLGLGIKSRMTPFSIVEAINSPMIKPNDLLFAETEKLKQSLRDKGLTNNKKEEIAKTIKENEDKLKKTLSIGQIDDIRVKLARINNLSVGVRKIANFAYSTWTEASNAYMDLTFIEQAKLKNKGIMNCDDFCKSVMSKQIHTIILNQDTDAETIDELRNCNFFGFNPDNLLFMVVYRQPVFTIDQKTGVVVVDKEAKPMLHNHGVFRMHTVMDNQFFRIESSGDEPTDRVRRIPMSFNELKGVFEKADLFVSNNIEDLDQLSKLPFDLASMALGLKLGDEGAEMVMTATKQKTPAQKGGFFAIHNGEVHCYENDTYPSLKAADIPFLNKNVNMFPNPLKMLESVKKGNLPTHTSIKEQVDYKGDKRLVLVPQTPQGDVNFILNMKIIKEPANKMLEIRNIKEQGDIPDAVKAFCELDNNPAFVGYVKQFTELKTLREVIEAKMKNLGMLQSMIDGYDLYRSQRP
ncbi:MAG: hypothetical protein PHF25_05840 [Candidatus Margulisbacteria bacterium]|nr:hypothetical protein [Candidatus Margulisiibacteriota bacterium]